MKKLLFILSFLAWGIPVFAVPNGLGTSTLQAAQTPSDTDLINASQVINGSWASREMTALQLKTYVLSAAVNVSSINGQTGTLTFALSSTGTLNTVTASSGSVTLNIGTAAAALTVPWTGVTGAPTIPAAQVNSDWKATNGVAQILNEPVAGTVTITTGNDFVTVAGLTLPYTPSYVFATVRKSNAAGANYFATVRAGTLTSTGFTVDLSGQVTADSYTYNLDYYIVP